VNTGGLFFQGVPDLTINSFYYVGGIDFISNYNMSTTTSGGVTIRQYRYVLIPAGVITARSAVNWNDYSQVKSYLGLKD
jgi:hypothetical protein